MSNSVIPGPREARSDQRLGLSVVWSYLFAVLLMLFIFLILVPDADGPSPWDAESFRSALLEMFANFRLLDELADLGIVKVADVGEGFLNVKLELLVVSDRRFGWAPLFLALVLVSVALLIRGIRQRFLAAHFGVPSSVSGQISSYFFGRGLNLFFPFGPGDNGVTQHLTDGGAPLDAATNTVFCNRLLDVLAIHALLLAGFVYLGWEGAIVPALWTLLLVAAIVSLTRPLGRGASPSRFNVFGHIWAAFDGPAMVKGTRHLLQRPSFLLGQLLLSGVALGLEIVGYWCIKQAFSSPLDDYVLMKELGFIQFAIVVAVANIARVLPYTFASFGVYEIVSVAMFRVFDEGFLAATTVSLLDSLLLNGLTLVCFVVVLWLGKCPSVFETWRAFFDHSVARAEAEEPPSP